MALKDFLFGKKGGYEQVSRYTPAQQNILNQILSGGQAPLGAGLQNLMNILSGSPEALEAFQKPSMTQFEEEIVPRIAERFSGMGAGSQRSSAFGQQLGRAGAGLAENLAAQRAGLQSQALNQLMSLLQQAEQPQFESVYRPGTQGFLGGLLPGLGQTLGYGLTSSIPAIGGGISSLFNLLTRSKGSGLRSGEMYNPEYGYRWAD